MISRKGVGGVAVKATWNEKQASDVTSQTRSDASGRFELVIQYSPYSGRTFGGVDRCEGTPPVAAISAASDGARPAGERVDLGSEYGEIKLVLH